MITGRNTDRYRRRPRIEDVPAATKNWMGFAQVNQKCIIGVCVIHWKGCSCLHLFIASIIIFCILSYQCLSKDKISTTPNHLQARTTTHDLAKQVAEVEKLTNESVTPLNDHSLFEKSRADVSKHLKHMFQHSSKKVNHFCEHFNYSSKLPEDRNRRDGLYQHLLYDDSKKIIFCYVPKAGCSNWKRMFAVLKGTEKANSTKRPRSDVLKKINRLAQLPIAEQNKRLNTYFKFAFVRNPLERIVSSYRNKIAAPINYANRAHWPDDALFHIIKTYSKDKYAKWKEANFTSSDIHPSFKEFIKYLIDSNLDLLNEHFRPFINLCRPCSLHYDFIGNFHNLPNEAYQILDFLKIPRNYYLNHIGHPKYNTSSLVPEYYNQLPASLLLKLLKHFSQELILYYLLFPADLERDNLNMQLLSGQLQPV